jgi:hypothetical protein
MACWKHFFPIFQRFGLHVVPNHFYYPVPDTRTLKEELWSSIALPIGIDLAGQRQSELLESFVAEFKAEYAALSSASNVANIVYRVDNPGFGPVDSEVYYCMIRRHNPKRIVEVGAGNSTVLAALALSKNASENAGCHSRLTYVDPYATVRLPPIPGVFLESIRERVQDVPIDLFQSLTKDDILFLDSSHVLQIGSDVQYEFLDILPRLNPGVLVHIHDIFIPANYPREWILDYRFWNEQYVLQAFLTFNDHYEVLWSSSYMHLNHSGSLDEAFGSYNRLKNWPASMWIRRVR